MADIEAIRRGLAANLRAAIPTTDGMASPYLLENPSGPALQVVGFENIDYIRSFGPGVSLEIVVEGCVPMVLGDGASRFFDRWVLRETTYSVADALEADRRLTSRLRDNGTVLGNQAAAADDLQVREFRGYRRLTIANGVDALVGDWLVQVEI